MGNNFFARLHASEKRLLQRSCESLLGICTGLLADQRINEAEIRFLDLWLADNRSIAEAWPGNIIARRVRDVLADGIVTDDELHHLKDTLAALIDGTLEETGSPSGGRPTQALPFDQNCTIDFRHRRFCLTGEFLYGPRMTCIEAIVERGGEVLNGIRRDLDFLVVGAMISAEWKYSSFGTKIEKAVAYREKGLPLAIVSEDRWTHALST